MFGFLKKLFGKGEETNSSAQASAAVGQTPTTPGATAAPVPGAVDQVGTPPPVTPVAPAPTVEVPPPTTVDKPA